MKTINAIIIIALLSGCSWMSPSTFDSNEYGLLVELETHSRLMVGSDCDNTDAAKHRIKNMRFVSEQLTTYAYYLPENKELYEITKIINENVSELEHRYSDNTPSAAYCKLKAKLIIINVRRALETLGNLQ